jgi:hypothetical protein
LGKRLSPAKGATALSLKNKAFFVSVRRFPDASFFTLLYRFCLYRRRKPVVKLRSSIALNCHQIDQAINEVFMRLFQINAGGTSRRWIDLDSATQVFYPADASTPTTIKLLIGQAEINVADPDKVKEIAVILGISLAST